MRTSITLDEFQESSNSGAALNSEAADLSSGKPSFWKRLFGGATQATLKASGEDAAHQEPAPESSSASESAQLATPDSSAPVHPVEALIDEQRVIPTTQFATPIPLANRAPTIANDDSMTEESGGTPLHTAASLSQVEATTSLLAQGADVAATDHHGRTPLHLAVLCESKEVAELLLNHGANVNARNAFGLAPLHTAARFGMKDLAELLMARAADVNVADHYGETPLRCAIERGHDEIAELLRRNGAEEPAAIEQTPQEAPPGALIQSVVVEMPGDNQIRSEFENKGESQNRAEEMSREEVQNRRFARKKAARDAKRARSLSRDLQPAMAA